MKFEALKINGSDMQILYISLPKRANNVFSKNLLTRLKVGEYGNVKTLGLHLTQAVDC